MRHAPSIIRFFTLLLILMSLLILCPRGTAAQSADFTELSIEELMDVEVTSVSKRPQKQSNAPAAIFVITGEDIKRSGVTSIPEALRMAPGINVARIDANKWAISSRGFNGRFSNKLLVLMDGRSIYSPSFSGVYWEVQDTLLADVERIEVIRGPGATLWGANAVNGVINIITKDSADTTGGLITAGAGTAEKLFGGVRYGAVLGESTYWRAFVKGFDRDDFKYASGDKSGDDWGMIHGGMRLDSDLTGEDHMTLEANVYGGDINQTIFMGSTTYPYHEIIDEDVDSSGWNILARWRRNLSAASDVSFQVYYDSATRNGLVYDEKIDTIDLDFQHHFPLGARHDIVWGVGYRHIEDAFDSSRFIVLDPDQRSRDLFSGFIQDEINLIPDRLWLTLGSKFEHNDYTGYEMQPSARLFWNAHSDHKFWGAVSRAVRTPSRWEKDGTIAIANVIPPLTTQNQSPFPILLRAQPDPDFDVEKLVAWEAGYRTTPSEVLSLDIAVFYHEYDDLRGQGQGMPFFQGSYLELPVYFDTRLEGSTYGLEMAAAFQATDWWHWHLAYSYLKMDVDAYDENDIQQIGKDPRHQISLRTNLKLGSSVDLSFWFRYVDNLSMLSSKSGELFEVGNYATFDARLAWRLRDHIEFSIVGQNLLQNRHLEYVQESFTAPTEVPRSVYAQITWQF